MKRLLTALAFLTILPLPVGPTREEEIRDSLAVFPLAGLVVGLLLALPAYFLPGPESKALGVLIANYLLTRGLHFDGLVDTLEALGGGFTPPRRREIMKDTHIGALGLLAGALFLLLKFHCLSALGAEGMVLGALTAPVFGRGAIAYLSFASHSCSPTGLGALFAQEKRWSTLLAAGATTALTLLWLPAPDYLILLALTLLLGELITRLADRAFGGITGDVLGFGLELTEVGTLLVLGVRG
ncbi:MAG: adenosylcobinamide-GDP ribazoletransferase [Candidatus Tectomicrobia bacterium]|uniref:Adenosylcobinamide-GDP ribazoletransferase n=1 Tax=Tectimicrobiota bacterium TaxID=2528274 RepID=A0A932CNI6_UNCTE|nr:adenosylcobinamide-GDP ribazoletransferase [Candidatus Tectomicrobia bacterium]